MKVKCTNCGKVMHETTEHYNPDATPKGHFLKLLEPWKSWGWNTYDDQTEALSTTACSLMCCPSCSAPLAPKGRLTLVGEDSVPCGDLTCTVCGRVCKTILGLNSHMRTHLKD